ncbi:hypothetical protein LUZ61_009101 [Rhynchospora tenuis]|uniref:C2 domain-containing protein n=1 Tax=Rhynchospora tenuis TaxID=198213 RepID=A0AAD5ZWL0_9POAL|nr:hypothetical protein LUZ61_009101 [Rhynchospora tenuis]
MEKLMGLLKVKVVRGVNLAKRDARGSDPYVVLKMGSQKVKTSVKKKDVNPEWNEELTLSISDPTVPIKLEILDKDTFTKDDLMGEAEFTIHDLAEVAQMNLNSMPHDTIVKTLHPTKQNSFVSDSHITVKNGKVFQDLHLRLKNVDSGDIYLQLQWIKITPSAH